MYDHKVNETSSVHPETAGVQGEASETYGLSPETGKMGWGASCQNVPAGGPWTSEERVHSINYLGLLAAFLALQTFALSLSKVEILLLLDNVTAIAYLNRMGGSHSDTLSHLAVEVWR